jgi:hypothetical protein
VIARECVQAIHAMLKILWLLLGAHLPAWNYEHAGGVNYQAMAALGIGIAVALLGLVVPPLRWLYDYAWFVGFLTSGAAHFALMERGAEAAEELEPVGHRSLSSKMLRLLTP